jgi:hypothetical protein
MNLHPAGFRDSSVADLDGTSQVGNGTPDGPPDALIFPHALLWYGSAERVVDLHPAGFDMSIAIGVAGSVQVGVGNIFNEPNDVVSHALAWRGTAESVVDLHQFLTGLGPSLSISVAQGVDINGDIVGIAWTANGQDAYAVKWTLVPEPSSAVLLVLGALGISFLAKNSCCASFTKRVAHSD